MATRSLISLVVSLLVAASLVAASNLRAAQMREGFSKYFPKLHLNTTSFESRSEATRKVLTKHFSAYFQEGAMGAMATADAEASASTAWTSGVIPMSVYSTTTSCSGPAMIFYYSIGVCMPTADFTFGNGDDDAVSGMPYMMIRKVTVSGSTYTMKALFFSDGACSQGKMARSYNSMAGCMITSGLATMLNPLQTAIPQFMQTLGVVQRYYESTGNCMDAMNMQTAFFLPAQVCLMYDATTQLQPYIVTGISNTPIGNAAGMQYIYQTYAPGLGGCTTGQRQAAENVPYCSPQKGYISSLLVTGNMDMPTFSQAPTPIPVSSPVASTTVHAAASVGHAEKHAEAASVPPISATSFPTPSAFSQSPAMVPTPFTLSPAMVPTVTLSPAMVPTPFTLSPAMVPTVTLSPAMVPTPFTIPPIAVPTLAPVTSTPTYSPSFVNQGFITMELSASPSCLGPNLMATYSLGQCAFDGGPGALMFTNYNKVTPTTFTVVQSTFADQFCTQMTSQTTMTFSTTCFANIYKAYYSAALPITASSGVAYTWFNTMSDCINGAMPSVQYWMPSGACFPDIMNPTGTGTWILNSCTGAYATSTEYSGSTCTGANMGYITAQDSYGTAQCGSIIPADTGFDVYFSNKCTGGF